MIHGLTNSSPSRSRRAPGDRIARTTPLLGRVATRMPTSTFLPGASVSCVPGGWLAAGAAVGLLVDVGQRLLRCLAVLGDVLGRGRLGGLELGLGLGELGRHR